MEQVRFGDRLRIDITADDGLAGALVPPMILQPLVENAVQHGVSRRPGAAHIRITVRRSGDALLLSVHDDGVGFRTAGKIAGLGIVSMRERMRASWRSNALMSATSEPPSKRRF